jgi:hypothetical protein
MQLKCGTELPEGAKFCLSCGKRAPRPLTPDGLIIRQADPLLTPFEAFPLLKISRWKLDELRIQRKLPGECYVALMGEESHLL